MAQCVRDSLRYGGFPWARRGGHSAVTNSLLEGLRRIDRPPVYNPVIWHGGEVHPIGIVAGIDTLRWAQKLYSHSLGPQVCVGPNVVVRPTDAPSALSSAIVKCIITPSLWVSKVYASDLPEIGHKLVEWPAGVDSSRWIPAAGRLKSQHKNCLIYLKGVEPSAAEATVAACTALGLSTRILEYSKYKSTRFLAELQQARAMVVIGGPESQGLAMFEAWSTDVPTFVRRWEPLPTAGIPEPQRIGELADTCASPFLTENTGAFWTTAKELAQHLSAARDGKYSPRQWILENATLEKAAERYLTLLYGPDTPAED